MQVDGLDLTLVDDGFILYNATCDRVHYLNHAAALVLTLCDGRKTREDLAALLQRQFDLPDPTERDVADIVNLSVDERLVVADGAAGRTTGPDLNRSWS